MSRLLHAGQRVGHSYEVERYLGAGAYAEVYRVRHRYLGRLAMKVFKQVGSAVETERMLGEAVLLSRLSHPNIVRVFDADTVTCADGEHGFFTTEYIAGGTLQELQSSRVDRILPVATAVELLGQICDGLAVAHAQRPPIVHRDLIPQNVLVGTDGDGGLQARIADFGLARHADPLTHRLSAQGTLAFKAPEALREPGADSPAGDVFAVGVIGYLLLTAALPYGEPEGPQAWRGDPDPPIPPAELNPEVDDSLSEVLLRAVEPDPRSRPADASVLRGELAAWSAHTAASRVTDRVARARQLAAAGRLAAAADLLETAIADDQGLRRRYAHQVAAWRRGVMA
jgi:serine/threonine-protein kinase